MIMMERRCIILCIFLKAFPISSAASDLIHFRRIRLRGHLLKLHPSLPHRLSYVEMSLRKSETLDRTETIFFYFCCSTAVLGVGDFFLKSPEYPVAFFERALLYKAPRMEVCRIFVSLGMFL